MTKWTRSLILGFLGYLLPVTTVLAFGNIYQEAIPHLKACISLIQEQEGQQEASHPVGLRMICPTLADFLTYEPLSEIDPPLENYSSRLQLASLVAVLEASKPVNQPVLTDQFIRAEITPVSYENEPLQKPFFLALAHWSFSQVQTFLIGYSTLTQPRIQHTIYITLVNLVIITSLTIFILYIIMSGRSSRLYVWYFKKRWQHQSRARVTQPDLDDIASLKFDIQIPALIHLIKQNYQLAGNLQSVDNITNAKLLQVVSRTRPQHIRDITRLIRLYDRLQYGGKTVAADEINNAIEMTRNILTNREAP